MLEIAHFVFRRLDVIYHVPTVGTINQIIMCRKLQIIGSMVLISYLFHGGDVMNHVSTLNIINQNVLFGNCNYWFY